MSKINVLILGSGGREHAFAWKICQSVLCGELYVVSGNAGTAQIAQNINLALSDFHGIGELVIEKNISLVVVGPENPLVDGIADFFASEPNLKNIALVAPNKAAARLEGTKDFSKAFMRKYKIPTARAVIFDKKTLKEGLQYLEFHPLPIVLKADGLAAGKGVLICETRKEAQQALREMIEGEKFGQASAKVLVEEFLKGIELSVFVLTDGISYKILPSAKDYKRIGNNDTGLNTGGMGAVSPVPFADDKFMAKVEENIIKPTINGLKNDNIDFIGFIFIGIMNVGGEPYVIEYNVRMGDPETEVVIPRLKSDFLALMNACAHKKLDTVDIEIDQRTAATVVLVSGGYPEAYEKGYEIAGLEATHNSHNALVFHAGTTLEGGKTITAGGRVLAITGLGNDLDEALTNAYNAAAFIDYEKIYFRNDIGKDLQ